MKGQRTLGEPDRGPLLQGVHRRVVGDVDPEGGEHRGMDEQARRQRRSHRLRALLLLMLLAGVVVVLLRLVLVEHNTNRHKTIIKALQY